MTERLIIPVLDAEEVVSVHMNELPAEPEVLLEIFAAEAAPLSLWYDCARAYLQQGNVTAFQHICGEATRAEVAEEISSFFGRRPTYEQIQFHCASAALAIASAKEERTPAGRSAQLSIAAQELARAQGLDTNEQLVMIGQGLLHLARGGEVPQARHEFMRALTAKNNGQANILGYLALAGLLFSQAQYKEALSLYRRALREHPGCPAEVRLGIAACCFRLGDPKGAQAAYERVLQLDPDSAHALLGLATLKLNAANAQQGLVDGVKMLVRAFELDPYNVGVVSLLAHYCLLKGSYEQVLVLAHAALAAAETDAVRAESQTQLARAYHALGRFQEARQHYVAANRLDPAAALPHLGMAQMYCKQGELINAASELQTALQSAPGFYDALKLLGHLYPHNPGKVKATTDKFREASQKQSHDAEIWEMLGELLAPSDPAGSLAAYKKALELHRERQKEAAAAEASTKAAAAERAAARADRPPVGGGLFGSDSEDEDDDAAAHTAAARTAAAAPSAKLLNNAAVLYYRSGDVPTATALLEEAAKASNDAKPGSAVAAGAPLQAITMRFNRARLREAAGEQQAAKEGYEAVLASCPSYIDCYLRLACISRTIGAHKQALQYAQRALDAEGGHADALALMGMLHTERREWDKANTVLQKLNHESKGRREVYGRLAHANTYIYTAPKDRRKESEAAKATERFTKALLEYRSLLEQDPSNVFAANGVGAALAELGHLDAAKDVFGEVQAAVAASNGFLQVPDVLINQANVALAKQEYATAIKLYQIAMEKGVDRNKSQILLYLARAHYDSDDLKSAKQCLLRAIHLAPTDYKLRFNAALTMQEWAVRMYRKKRPPNDPTKIVEYSSARDDLGSALKYFEHLRQLSRERSGLEDVKLDAHISFCKGQTDNAAKHVAAAEAEAHEMMLKRQEQAKLLEAAERSRQAEELRKEAAERAAAADRERKAREAGEKLEALQQGWKAARTDGFADGENVEAGATVGAGKKRKGGADGGKGGGKKKGGKKGGKGGGSTAWGDALDDVDGGGSGDDGLGAGGAGGERPPKAKKARKTKEGKGGGERKKKGGKKGGKGGGSGSAEDEEPEDEEAEYESESEIGDDLEEAQREEARRRNRPAAGSEDRDREIGLDDGGGGEDGGGGGDELEDDDDVTAGATAGRRKRLQAAGADGDNAEDGGDGGLEDDEDDGAAAAAADSRKRARQAALEDDDEEAAQGGEPAQGLEDEGAEDEPAPGEPTANADVDMADLFGDDDD